MSKTTEINSTVPQGNRLVLPSVQDVHQRAMELIYKDDTECSAGDIRNLLIEEFGLRLVREAAEDMRGR